MVSPAESMDPLFIGIDGGGSKCRATIVNANDEVLGTGVAGPANPLFGYAQAIDSIVRSAGLAMADAGLEPSRLSSMVAGIGLAGVNLSRLYNKVNAWAHPFAEMYLTTDLHTACLGAHKGSDGAVIITGTGSCGFSVVDGEVLNLGGHGFAIGDKGSGAWFGLEAVKHTLLALDGLAPPSKMHDELLQLLDCKTADCVIEQLAGKGSGHFARLAAAVFKAANAGDPIAVAIVEDGAGYISALARKLLETNPPRLSIIGGLGEVLMPWLDEDVARQIFKPLCEPEIGCILYAKQKRGGTVSPQQQAIGIQAES
ncbi:N-acetylglucosamine kinase [Biformimicrobium ophioploci]|uniref:BadF/BadG/BcrA/BcrD ATPase family protein n=1 Tax=Biformimicrobium ophioploci TaxID=3036711 RepID=A0ABQ6LWY4_9GAMM|nr:BadF/BadG/BcrA/BcrD ATPase family protein [Microbulbifer sp. NKW57]GMG86517.1 BadF/BadG/BcrA/BcrD ATPase family protein [Microbulbifer sp. NKW57]